MRLGDAPGAVVLAAMSIGIGLPLNAVANVSQNVTIYGLLLSEAVETLSSQRLALVLAAARTPGIPSRCGGQRGSSTFPSLGSNQRPALPTRGESLVARTRASACRLGYRLGCWCRCQGQRQRVILRASCQRAPA